MNCYLPDGDIYLPGVVCQPHALPSLCCNAGWICTDNGLCISPDSNNSYQGSCTDPDWNTTKCFGGCGCKSSGCRVKICSPGWGCCIGNTGCDCSLTSVSLPVGHIQTSLSPSLSASTSSTTSPSTSSTSSPSTPPSMATGSSGLTIDAKIGLGVGVPAVIIAAATLVAMLWFKARKNKNIKREKAEVRASEAHQQSPGINGADTLQSISVQESTELQNIQPRGEC